MLNSAARTALCALAVACAIIARTPAFAAAPPQPRGVVFYDQKFSSSRMSWNFKKQTRDFLTAFGFEAMHTDQLLKWLQAAGPDARGTLLVMNTDNLPAPLSAAAEEPTPLRSYLNAGGAILWFGGDPGAVVSYQLEPTQYPGESEAAALLGENPDWTDAARTLGIDQARARSFVNGSPGFVRIWDDALDKLTDERAAALFRAVSALLPAFPENKSPARIYLHRPSDYWPLAHRNGDLVDREVRVSYFHDPLPPAASYELVVSVNGTEKQRIPLERTASNTLIRELRVPLFAQQQLLQLVEKNEGRDTVLAEQTLAESAFFAGVQYDADPRINPVDMGTVLVPGDMVLAAPGQTIKAAVWSFIPGAGAAHAVTLTLEAQDKSGTARASAHSEISVREGVVADSKITLPLDGLDAPRFLLVLTASENGREIYRDKKWLILAPRPADAARGFGAFYESINYLGPVNTYDYGTKEWSSTTWARAWERGPADDVVVSFPNGNRFLFWRGSGYVPFWASWANSGMTYEWLEASQNRGALYDAVEPLQDKECRYSRASIVSSTPARAVVSWRYALIGMRYGINKNEWGDERYVFYPDGYGVRTATGYFEPLAWHESAEFIHILPAGYNPFDVYPPEMFRIMSPDGDKETRVTYPQAHGDWPANTPAVFRVNYNRRDASTPVLALRSFEGFGTFFDGWKDDGRYISPNYWGVHFPVQRGYPTTRQQPPGWRERAAHASLANIASTPLSTRMKSGGLEEKTWVWLMGNTDAPDADVLAAARSWIDPVPATVLSGGAGGEYDPAQRAYVVDLAGSPQAMITFRGTGTGRIFNPVLVLRNPPAGDAHIGINGDAPNTMQAAPESRYSESSLVVWIGESIPDNSKVTVLIK